MDKDLQARIDAANDEFLNDEKPKEQEVAVSPKPVDYYRDAANKAFAFQQRPRLNGSTQKVNVDVRAVLDRLAPQYKRAKDDSERLARTGDKEGARIVKEQYMRDVFLPVVEALVRENSPEEMMNATRALSEIDKYVLDGIGRADGYTQALVASLYQSDMGNVLPTSDIDVQRVVMNLKRLVVNDQIRAAVGMANKIKAKIDAGENTASQEDYELIQKIALRGQ